MDDVYRAPSRWVVAGLFCLLAVAGLGFLAAGTVAAVRGHHESRPVAVLGLQLAVLGVLGGSGMLRPRGTPPPAVDLDGGVALPLRRSHVPRQCAVIVVLGSLALTAALFDGRGWSMALAALVLVAAAGLAVRVATTGAAGARVRLDPEGITVPAGLASSRHLSWRDVDRIEGRPAWQPLLVVLPRKGDAIAFRLLPQAWSPTAIAAVVDHYADHAGPRRELVGSGSVERFRCR